MAISVCRILVLFVDVTMSAFWGVSDLDVTYTPGTKHVNITSPEILTCDSPQKTRCDRICVMTPGCRSYFYGPNTGVCQFHSDVFNSANGVALQQGLQYYYKGSATNGDARLKAKTAGAGTNGDVRQKAKTTGDDYTHLSKGRTFLYVKRHIERKTWHDALQVCDSEGGTLVKLDNQQKDKLFRRRLFVTKERAFLWIGLSDKYDNNTWYWTDGTRLGFYTNWGFREPHHVKNRQPENCVSIIKQKWRRVKWSDVTCNWPRGFVCEKFDTEI